MTVEVSQSVPYLGLAIGVVGNHAAQLAHELLAHEDMCTRFIVCNPNAANTRTAACGRCEAKITGDGRELVFRFKRAHKWYRIHTIANQAQCYFQVLCALRGARSHPLAAESAA